MKTCRKCGETKPLSEFYKNKESKDGHLNICKTCKCVYQRNRTENLEYINVQSKVCAKCGELKDSSEFHKASCNIDKLQHYCKDCIRAMKPIYRNTVKGKISHRASEYRRKGYGYSPINEPETGAHFHHLHLEDNHEFGIYIPEFIHTLIQHNSVTGMGMDTMNAMAWQYLLDEDIYEDN
jgi:protein-arginine kinase activator protein McsA